MEIGGKDYQALVFDFDGVLADSVEVKTAAFKAVFQEWGDAVQQKVAEHHLNHGGMTRTEKFVYYYKAFLGRKLGEEGLETLCRKFSSLVVEKVISAPEIPGAGAFLDRCRAEGIPCFVDSATPDAELAVIIRKRGIAGYFREILGADRSKRENLEWILETYGLEGEDCLFFGDAGSDYDAASGCGSDFLGILPNSEAPLLKAHPDITWARDFIEVEKGDFYGRAG